MRKQALHPRTAIINKKQKIQSKQARSEALRWLIQLFPSAFDSSTTIRPLKLGIMTDILTHTDAALAAGISKSKLREAVVQFTRRIDYLTCLKAREMRIDLEGNPITQVTEDESTRASLKIKKRVEKSTKNAKKNLINKSQGSTTSKSAEHKNYKSEQDAMPHYPERPPAFSAQNNPTKAASSAPVLIKHKSFRAFDPEAVARLKEKLGLSLQNKIIKETTE